jgi:hypothetical protein
MKKMVRKAKPTYYLFGKNKDNMKKRHEKPVLKRRIVVKRKLSPD